MCTVSLERERASIGQSVMVSVLLPLLLSCLFLSVNSQGLLGVYLVYSDSGSYNSTSALNGAMDAVQEFAGHLPGHSINFTTLDDKCNVSRGLQESFQYVSRPPPFISIIGGGCPSSTSAQLEIAEYLGIPLISYNPSLMRDSGNYVQVFPSRHSLVESLAAVIKQYGWSQIAVISEAKNIFLEVEYTLQERLKSDNVKVIDSVHIWPTTAITESLLFSSEARIFFLNTYEDTARKVLCQAYHNQTHYPGYAWLLYGWYNDDWFMADSSITCTQQEINTALHRAIVIKQHKISATESDAYVFAYDAMKALLLGLIRTQSMINNGTMSSSCSEGVPSSLNETSNCLLRSNIIESTFTGKSGTVSFTSNGIRDTMMTYISQYRAGNPNPQPFATVNMSLSNSFSYFSNGSNSTVWPDGIPPDGTPIFEFSSFSIILIVVMYIWSSIGIIFTVFCLVFNIIFRNRKIIRLTSPNLNYFIIAGAVLLFSIPYITLQPSNAEEASLFACIANIWFLSLGITLYFAPILAKMLRIYRIFRNPRANKKVLTDWHLFFLVLIMVSIIVVLLFLGTVIPYTRPVVSYSEDLEKKPEINEDGIKVIYQGVNCYTDGSFAWIIIIYIYILLLEAFAVVLAVKTRGVKVEAVNDSKEVVAIVYIVTACSVALIIVAYVLQEFSNIAEGFYLTAALIGTTSTITLMFLPKMWSLYKDPNGENVFEQQSFRSSSALQSQMHRQDSEKIVSLQREVGTLKKILRENSVRLMSVPEAPNEVDYDSDHENKNGRLANSCSHLPEVFSDPLTPGDEEKRIEGNSQP